MEGRKKFGTHQILVNERQRGNPLLHEMRNVPFVFEKGLVPDFLIGAEACALFISVKYFLLKPQYLPRRLSELNAGNWRLRVLLCLVDVEDADRALHDLNVAAVHHECTLVLARSTREAARLLECFKAYEHSQASAIKEHIDRDHLSKLTDVLTTVKPVNKTNVVTLARTFGSLSNVINATADDLTDCPGLGHKKIHTLLSVFQQPFSLAARTRREASRATRNNDGEMQRNDDEMQRKKRARDEDKHQLQLLQQHEEEEDQEEEEEDSEDENGLDGAGK